MLRRYGLNLSWSVVQYQAKRYTRRFRKTQQFFPPDYKSHHLFLPSLTQVVEDMEALKYPVKVTNIGLEHDEFVAKMTGIDQEKAQQASASHSRADRRRMERPSLGDIKTCDELIQAIPTEVATKKLDYSTLQLSWYKTKEGKEQIRDIAHHYHIYRDLFSSPSMVPSQMNLPKPNLPPNWMYYSDHEMTATLFAKWFPGAMKLKDPPPFDVYHFLPNIPMTVEFGVEESLVAKWEDCKPEGKPTDILISPVLRGNVIMPVYASARPSVTIDARIETEMVNYPDTTISESGVSVLGKGLYSLLLLSLDSIFGDDHPVCHWFVRNISAKHPGEEVVPYMPVFGMEGLGYHRYVFLLIQHENDLKNVSLSKELVMRERQLNLLPFLQENNARPVGLSWFQTEFDSYSKDVMHNLLKMRSPVYEYIEEEEPIQPQIKHPFSAPFNIYLDHYRDPKEIAKDVFLERLKKIDPLNYDKEFDIDPLPNARIPAIREIRPSWMQASEWKRRNRLHDFRGLRPSSMKVPLNNNPDLDKPFWPPPHYNQGPNKYPLPMKQPKPIRETKWAIPVNEHPSYYKLENHLSHEDVESKEEKD